MNGETGALTFERRMKMIIRMKFEQSAFSMVFRSAEKKGKRRFSESQIGHWKV